MKNFYFPNNNHFGKIILLFWFFITSYSYSQSYLVHNYSQEEGLPNSNVYSILQGKYGRIWIGTRNGISVYDGLDWKYYNINNGLPNNDIYALKLDSTGAIWASSSKNKLKFSRFDGIGWHQISNPDFNLPDNLHLRSFDVLCDGKNTELLAITDRAGFYYFNGSAWTHISGKLEGIFNYNIITYSNKFLIATNNGIVEAHKGKIDFSLNKILPQEYKNVLALSIEYRKDGDIIWVLSSNCLGYIKNNKYYAVSRNINLKDNNYFQPFQFIPDYYGYSVFGNYSGLYFLNKSDGTYMPVTEKSGIRILSPACLMIDREFNLWIGGVQGISKLVSMRFLNYRQRTGLLKDEVSAICERKNGEIIFGHINGLSILKNDRIQKIIFSEEKSFYDFNKVLDLCTDNSNNVWIAGEKFGLGKLTIDEKLKWIKISNNGLDFISSVVQDKNGNIFAISGKTLYEVVDDRLIPIFDKHKADIIYYRKLFVSPANELCIVTSTKGIVVIKEKKLLRIIKCRSKSKTNDVYSLLFNSGNEILAGTSDGLYKVVADSLVKVNSQGLKIDLPVYNIVKDKSDNIWFGTNSGTIRWDGSRIFEYTISSGLSGMETNRDAAFIDSKGNYWIGTDRGVSKYQRLFDTKPAALPSVLVETIEPHVGMLVPSGKNNFIASSGSLVCRVKIISFLDEYHNQFAFNLEGFDPGWNYSDSRNPLIRYTSLPSGTYKLLIKCKNSEGLWSKVYTVGIIEVPHSFFQSWWFYSLLFVSIILIFIGFINYRVRVRFANKLQREVVKRTAMLKESERRYRQMFEKNQAIMLLIDEENLDIVDANESAERFYGFDKKTLINFNYTRLSTTGSIQDIFERIQNSIETKTSKLSVHRIKGGMETFVEVSFSEIEISERNLYYAIIYDVGAKVIAEEALKESEEKYRTLIESMIDGVFVIQEGILLFVNNALANFIGYSPDELTNKNFDSFIAPEDLEIVKYRYFSRLKGGGVPTEYEFKLLHKDGTTRISILIHVSIFSYKGKPATLGTIKNITQSRIQELKIKQFHTAIEQAQVGVMITNFNNDIEYVNPKFCQISGYNFNEIIGRKPYILQGQDKIQITDRIRLDVKHGKIWTGEILNRKKDGTFYWVNATVSPIRNTDGEITHFISVEQDVTFEKYAREEIKQNERLLSSIISHAPVIISAVDKNGIITFLRGKELENYGISYESIIGESVYKYFINDNEFISEFSKALNGEIFSAVKFFDNLVYELHFNPVTSGEGIISGTIILALNITERYNIQQGLIAAKEEAERSDRLKSDFLAQMSHEIRTPVNTILNFISLLRDEVKNKISDELGEVFNFIDDGGRRLIRTIDMILNMSQFQSGTYKPIKHRTDLDKDVLSKIVPELKSTASHKNLELNLFIETKNTFINADSYTVGQIFINLIDNAIKYTHLGRIDVKIFQADSKINVSVSDTGIGIARDYQPHLFEAFSQEETGYSRRFEGTGLGLALVKKYLEINDAEIKVESVKGEGTKFTVIFQKID